MTTSAPVPGRIPTPRPKAAPTTSLGSGPGTVPNQRPAQSPAPGVSGARAPTQAAAAVAARRTPRTPASDALSDKATVFLIRRILCPQHLEKGRSTPAPIEELLPPLTSRNDVDLQLYALIAIILREYVQNWYSKITPDETFVAEIVQIIAHCTRALEQRLRMVDLESLLLDELPDLLDRHITASRAARSPVAQPPLQADPHEVYHSLCPLPALSPVPKASDPSSLVAQAENEAAYRQLLVRGVLAVLLPTEDLENECLTALVGQIFSELIIGNIIANRLSEPWLIWEGLIIASRVMQQRRDAATTPRRPASGGQGKTGKEGKRGFSMHGLFWTFLQWCFLLTGFVRTLVGTLVISRSLPSRSAPARGGRVGQDKEGSDRKRPVEPTEPVPPLETCPQVAAAKVPVIAFRCWTALSNLVELNARMPWACGTLSMLQWFALVGPGRIAAVDGIVDRFLSHVVHQKMLDPAQLPPLLRTVRGSLFPNNMPGKSTMVAPSSAAELQALRRRCARALWALVPRGVARAYFGGSISRSNGIGGGAVWAPWSWPDPLVLDEGDQGLGSEAQTAAAAATATATALTSGPSPGLVSQERSGPRSGQSEIRSSSQDKKSSSSSSSISESSSSNSGPPSDLADEQVVDEIENGILDVFGDAYCNKHLMYSVLELVLVRLMPELAEKGTLPLWEERLS